MTIKLKQNTQEWHVYRSTRIGASEVSIILGINPYTNKIELWDQKKGLMPMKIHNKAMKQGMYLEPKARDLFNETTGKNFKPEVVECTLDGYEFLHASLDGKCGDEIVEIKCPSAIESATWQSFINSDIIPDYYWVQVQMQMLCAGVKKAYFYMYSKKIKHFTVVDYNDDFIKEILPKLKEFKDLMQCDTNPFVHEGSYVSDYLELDKQEKEIKEKKDAIKQQMITEAKRDIALFKWQDKQVTLSYVKKMTVNYAQLCTDLSIDKKLIDQYSRNTVYPLIKVSKKKVGE